LRRCLRESEMRHSLSRARVRGLLIKFGRVDLQKQEWNMSMINKGLSLVAISLLLVVGGCASTSQPAAEAVVEAPVETQAVAEVVEVEPIQPMVQGGKIVLPNDPGCVSWRQCVARRLLL